MYRVTADTMGIQTLTMNGLFAVLSASLLLVGMLAVMLWVDWYLTLLAWPYVRCSFVQSRF